MLFRQFAGNLFPASYSKLPLPGQSYPKKLFSILTGFKKLFSPPTGNPVLFENICLALACICLLSFYSSSQVTLSKLGKDAKDYGLGYGILLPSISLPEMKTWPYVELAELTYFQVKGENISSGSEGKGYGSVKLSYKYVFIEAKRLLRISIAGLIALEP